jgi:uracil-DNA glycosylase
VIIGQDPYHNPGEAHGLAFSVKRGVKTPRSLGTIFREIMACNFMATKPIHGNLDCWADQGVLLLNTVLTVEANNQNSHKNKGWERFTDAIVDALNHRPGPGLVFLLWGRPAQEKGSKIDRRKHLVIETCNPAAYGNIAAGQSFSGSKCFARANQWLVAHGRPAVNWRVY